MSVISKVYSSNTYNGLSSWAFLGKLLSEECHIIHRMISQLWFRKWIGATRQQTSNCAKFEPDLCCICCHWATMLYIEGLVVDSTFQRHFSCTFVDILLNFNTIWSINYWIDALNTRYFAVRNSSTIEIPRDLFCPSHQCQSLNTF